MLLKARLGSIRASKFGETANKCITEKDRWASGYVCFIYTPGGAAVSRNVRSFKVLYE